ncbi:DUF2520 domain-containing protein [Streptomyces noursei]|uniref:Rossmann-like and DUF2520 domain-containing protein n=1 Tax=Streptomyces noursei TaxID=1971 RepID=UPI00033784ED|nr:DUF2520 domain-containing protein [Streptomyces noursei]AKA05257.1 coenzyme F420-dependent NADP oxidoreductase [Streptomyces noursei ZPM]EPY92982.1 hypothetical protein K530_50490 [Streptomyces noursei CCRC 11814]EXU87572.1 oxidoreductase [Streptomyces noursei PD-1]UWS73651.1 DUF2520 domain-containing protein [Streptomyces noursei]
MNPHPSTEAQDRPARLTVGVVGAGRVGPALAAALQLAGHRPVAVSGVSDASVRRAAEMLPGVPLVTPGEVLARADLVLLTVPDDALADLVAGLVETGAVRPGQLLVHTSGRFGTAVLEPATRAGALPLALHPAMTFTGTSVDVQRLAGCPFGVTAPQELRMAAEALVIEMGGEPEWIAESARPLYHAALAIGANYLVTLVAQAMELLQKAGVQAPDRMLGPLLGAALDNALRSGDAALTGPVARGDAGTVAAHVAELRTHAPQALAGYLAMARTTADRALAHGLLKPELAEELLDVLAGPAPDSGTGPGARPGEQGSPDDSEGTGGAEGQQPEAADHPTGEPPATSPKGTGPKSAAGPTAPEGSDSPADSASPDDSTSPDDPASPDHGPHGGGS